MKPTLKCFGCKQEFRREELVAYASTKAAIMHNYCPKCLKEKQDRDNFSDKVCQIFGIKGPNARIWTERKRLMDKFGYTDQIIIDCLEYIYNVEHYKKFVDSICLVTPAMVDKMMRYKKNMKTQQNMLATAAKTQMVEHVVSIKENTKTNKKILNADDFLE